MYIPVAYINNYVTSWSQGYFQKLTISLQNTEREVCFIKYAFAKFLKKVLRSSLMKIVQSHPIHLCGSHKNHNFYCIIGKEIDQLLLPCKLFAGTLRIYSLFFCSCESLSLLWWTFFFLFLFFFFKAHIAIFSRYHTAFGMKHTFVLLPTGKKVHKSYSSMWNKENYDLMNIILHSHHLQNVVFTLKQVVFSRLSWKLRKLYHLKRRS